VPGTGCPLLWNDYFFFVAFFFAGFFFPPGFPPGGIEPSLDTTCPVREGSEFVHRGQGTHPTGRAGSERKNPHGPGLFCPNRAGNVEEGKGPRHEWAPR
jgi:hypothetical protein